MARILYGVHGTGHGHAMRALAVARRFPEHEFLFVTHKDGLELLSPEFETVECPNPETPVKGHKVDGPEAVWSTLKVFGRFRGLMGRILTLIDRFRPDVAFSDYEFFVPRAAARVGLPCLSIDHQHIVTLARHRLPVLQMPSYLTTSLAVSLLFSRASHHLIISFYQPPLKPGHQALALPPLLRETVLRRTPRDGEHILAYHGYPTFGNFFEHLKKAERPVMVYGSHMDRRDGNLVFKKNSEEGFLDDLASSAYVVCGGGHTLISEALYFGKPVMTFPIKNAFEQYLNGHYIERLGYGRMIPTFRPGPETILEFEARLDEFRGRVRQGDFFGNDRIFSAIDSFIQNKNLEPPK